MKYGRYFLVSPHDLQTADRLFAWASSSSGPAFAGDQNLYILPAGISHMSFRRFLVYTVLGSAPWSILFVYLGFKLGQNWNQVRRVFEQFDLIIVAGLIALVILYVARKVRRHRSGISE